VVPAGNYLKNIRDANVSVESNKAREDRSRNHKDIRKTAKTNLRIEDDYDEEY